MVQIITDVYEGIPSVDFAALILLLGVVIRSDIFGSFSLYIMLL